MNKLLNGSRARGAGETQTRLKNFARGMRAYTSTRLHTFLETPLMITGTNTYAENKISELRHTGKLTRGSRWNNWKPVTETEMGAVMAIIINMGIMSIPNLEAYWKMLWECYIPFFHDVMGRNRFQQIFWNLHIPQPPQSSRRVDKISALLDHVRRKSQSAFKPGKEVSVDETMVGFRGRVSFKQYCPKKPTKYELKFFVLADSSTGYV